MSSNKDDNQSKKSDLPERLEALRRNTARAQKLRILSNAYASESNESRNNETRTSPLILWSTENKLEAEALAERLERTVKKLDADISELKSQSGNGITREDIESIVEELKEAREQAIDIGKNVIMPKDLNLRLVRADLLDRLDEYRSHEGHNFLMLGLFGGGAFGIIVNWITSADNVKTDSSITLLCILIALILYFGYKTFETSRRASKVKKQIFEDS
ncbi:MAG: hypothetical protein AAGA46_03110 [Cyanobacteria bacterium P01_F01_bin.13]